MAPVAIRQMRHGRGIVVTGDQRASSTGVTNMAHILVVDDDPSLRNLMRRFLSANGYDVSTAEDGQAALAAVSERLPDLVISDIALPRMNGVELMQALQAWHPSIPILVVSAYDPAEFPDVPVLAKPFQLVQLLDAVRTRLSNPSTTRG